MADNGWCALGYSCTTPTDDIRRKEVEVKLPGLFYQIDFDSNGNRLLTPLDIFDFEEIAKGSSLNTELIDFSIHNRKKPADTVTIEVFDDARLVYAEQNAVKFIPSGVHIWQWDGYGSDGILDTRVLKSKKLKVVLTATKDTERQVLELKLRNKAKEVDWADVRIDRNAKVAEITVRLSFSDGGVEGTGTPTSYADLEHMAARGIEFYWARSGKRGGGIGNPIDTSKGVYKVLVKADLNIAPKAEDFPLIEKLDPNFGRATSLGGFRKIYHNLGFWGGRKVYADKDFEHTSAHEFGHLILNGYGRGWPVPNYSWGHKGSSTVVTQTPLEKHPIPKSGEIDLMEYHSDHPTNLLDYWDRSAAHEQDVKGLIWLTRTEFND